MLEEFGKTPADLGVSWDEVDPQWHEAMLIIDGARRKEEKIMIEAKRGR